MNMPCFVLAVCFWVLAAIAVVLFAAWVYVEVQYYHWNKQERESDQLVKELSERIAEKIEEVRENSDENENNS